MSLKARIEAVIYAAEEPVTLAQLTTLFRDEALASRAARLAPAEPIADPDAPAESDLPADLAAATAGEFSETGVLAGTDLSEVRSADGAGPDDENREREAWSKEPAVPSESAAQNSSDAEVATPDFAGEPQPYPNEPAEATTPGREYDCGLTPDEQRPDHANAPATNAEQAEANSESQSEDEAPQGLAEDQSEAHSAERVVPEREALSQEGREAPFANRAVSGDERKAARLRDREVREEIRRLLDELIAEYASAGRGVEIREIAGGFRMATRPEYHDAVRAFAKSLKSPMKLSLQALETLAVIAYKQPITAPEIAEIRGVDSGGVLGSLVARKLITTAGRKQVIGRPILYKTTKEFLLRFGLRDLNELPSLEEFEKMATELTESEEAAEELPFAQNEMVAVEEDAEENAERIAENGSEMSNEISAETGSNKIPAGDPEPPEPPITDPRPEEPPPPIEEPPAEPESPETDNESPSAQDLVDEAVPTSEYDAAGPGSGDPVPPPEEDGAATAEEHQP